MLKQELSLTLAEDGGKFCQSSGLLYHLTLENLVVYHHLELKIFKAEFIPFSVKLNICPNIFRMPNIIATLDSVIQT